MKNDAFIGGVEPGGLWNQTDIRILLCYILSSVNAPLSGEDLSKIVQGKGLANYFETSDALASLEKNGNLQKDEAGLFFITEKGREIAASLDTSLPISVRDKAREAAVSLLSAARIQRENHVEINKTDKGYQVDCHISGGDMDLMTLSLYAPDEAQARLIKENFYKNPGGIYKLLLAAITGDETFIRKFLGNMETTYDPGE